MESILQEIEQALNARLFYLAIVVTMTVPDACAALESPDGKTEGSRYQAWFKTNLQTKYHTMTPKDFWLLRCSILHQARLRHSFSEFSRVIFSVRDGDDRYLHNNLFNDALNLDAETFCRDVIAAARIWANEKRTHANVVKHLPLLMQLRPKGIPGYIVGLPVIG